MTDFFNHQQIPLLAETDILVIGAGSAGCIAALAASRQFRFSVMLVERYGFPGGSSTQMLDTFYGFFTPGTSPKKIVGGLPDWVVNELDKTNDIFLRPNTYGAGTGVNYNPERLKLVWDKLISEAGINYLLHTSLVDVVQEEKERITCILWNKSGFYKVKALRVIDASGDADFCALSGYQFELAGEREPAQSMTTTFRMCNVDQDKFEKAGGNKMMKERMTEAFQNKTHLLPRKEGSAHEMCQPSCISTVAVKVSDLNALQIEELTRRVYGEHRLTKEECLSGKIPATSVLLCGAPIEDHRKGKDGQDETYWEYIPGTGIYGVPYGTIVPAASSSTWVVGRCFSATHDAHASCRSMAQTMSMGQAAGLAVVQSLKNDCDAKDIDISLLRNDLTEIGQVLEVPDSIADTSRNGWKNNSIRNNK